MMRFGGQLLSILTVKAVSAAPPEEANAGGENYSSEPQKYQPRLLKLWKKSR
ncbi:hypothetical protein [Okeania sp. SIO2B3]|uniref:hypothetical protein n=1 Tax=Okeania sp. SIO2B3 TaxID=2607784 RepID=UPI0034143E41